MSLTYGTTQLSSKNYGAFIRPLGVFEGKYDNGFYTGGGTSGVATAHAESVIKALFMDMPVHGTAITAITAAVLNKVNIVDDASARTFATSDISTGSAGDVMVLFIPAHNAGMVVTDEGSKVFTSTGDNQGIVLYNPDASHWYIYDTVFVPVGVAQEQPKISSEKGEEVSDSYGNKLLTSFNSTIEAVSMQVNPDAFDFLNDVSDAECDFALYEHSSKGNALATGVGDGLLICSGATIAATTLGTGWMVKDINIVPKLLISGNTQNTITLSASKEFGVSEDGIVGSATYVKTV